MKLDLNSFEGHTPGPWKMSGHPGDDSGTSWRAVVYNSPFGEAYVSQRLIEDAKLIAAAPSLLALAREQEKQIKLLRDAAEFLVADFEAKRAAGSTSANNFSHSVSLARAALKATE